MYSHDPLSGAEAGPKCKCFGCANMRKLSYAFETLSAPVAYRRRVEIVQR